MPSNTSNQDKQKHEHASQSQSLLLLALQEQVAQLHVQVHQLDQKLAQVQHSNNVQVHQLDQKLAQVQINDTPEIDESNKYPPDCYSLIAKNCNGSTKSILCFSYGITVFLFQAAFFGLLLFSLGNEELGTTLDPGNPGTKENHNNPFLTFFEPMIAPNVKVVTLITQFLAFFAYIFFPESGLEDLVTACRFFPGFSCNPNPNPSNEPIWGLRFACTLRAIQGIFAIITAWLLIMSSESVIDIILNFAAMGFVSSLDESAFEFALNGIFGITLQKEAEEIKDGTHQLPEAAKKSLPKHFWYWIIMAFTGLIFLFLTSFVVSAQESKSQWITTEMRVQFNSNEFVEYSGCYEIDTDAKSDRRFSYRHMDSTAVIAYCLQERRWVLFDEDDTNTTVCDSMVNNINIGSSSRTDTFDVLASFEDPWLTASGAPLELYTFDNANEEGNELFCNLTLGDGKCDAAFNEPGYQYDGGDCCAATCVGSECGRNGIVGVFGSNDTANGYDCRNPEMKDITIRIDRAFVCGLHCGGVEPVYFSIDCNGKNVLTAFIKESMQGGTQTIQVEDGAKCSVLLRQTDDTLKVKYTIFYGTNTDAAFQVYHDGFDEDLYEHSSVNFNFTHIPECFVKELGALFGNVSEVYDILNAPPPTLPPTISPTISPSPTFPPTEFPTISSFPSASTTAYTSSTGTFTTFRTFTGTNEPTPPPGITPGPTITPTSTISFSGTTTPQPSISAGPTAVTSSSKSTGTITTASHNFFRTASPMISSFPSAPPTLLLTTSRTQFPTEFTTSSASSSFTGTNEPTLPPTGTPPTTSSFSGSTTPPILPPSLSPTIAPFSSTSPTFSPTFSPTGTIATVSPTITPFPPASPSFLSTTASTSASSTLMPTSTTTFSRSTTPQPSISPGPTAVTSSSSSIRNSFIQLRDLQGVSTSTSSISPAFDVSNLAMKWLADDYRNTEYCGSDDLIPRFALLTLYFALGTPDNFLTMGDHCSWPVVTCEGGLVTSIDVDGNGMGFDGGFPSEIGLLSNLWEIKMSSFSKLPSFPTEIGNLPYLSLDLSNLDYQGHNHLLHTLPTEIGHLSNLRYLNLDGNDSLHSLPSEIGNLSNLRHLSIRDSVGIPGIPSELGLLTNLNTISYCGHRRGCDELKDILGRKTGLKKTGIPSELGQLTNLGFIDVSCPADSDPGDDWIDCDFMKDILGRDIACSCSGF